MTFVYICSPFKSNPKENTKKAIKYSQIAYRLGFNPLCVHCFLMKVTGLTEENSRRQLLKLGREYIRICDELWICTREKSEGMKKEIAYARKNNIRIIEAYQLWEKK